MRPELSRHLAKAVATTQEVQRIVDFYKYLDDPRTVLVRGLLAMIIQHHRSVLLLIKRGIVYSAYALARDAIQALCRLNAVQRLFGGDDSYES